jgi:hypothetical protein
VQGKTDLEPDTSEAESYDSNERLIQLSEAEELFESLKETIASLFTLAVVIRNTAPRDRFAKALSGPTAFDETFDTMHVGHMYPKLNIDGTRWLRDRLGKAITQRRQFIRYSREHRQKLGREPAELWRPVIDAPRPPTTRGPIHLDNARAPHAASTVFTRSLSTLAPTSASTVLFVDGPIANQDIPDDLSQTSYALSSAESEKEGQLQLPSLHDVSRGQTFFECPLCWTMQSFRKESTWRKHAFADLRPYACTFGDCDVKLFADRRDWFDHELKHHRIQWHCQFCDRRDFAAGEIFRRHVRNDHVRAVTEDQLNAIIEACKRPVEIFSPTECPFCDSWEATLRSRHTDIKNEDAVVVTPAQIRHHIGTHMQHLALFAIPRGYLGDDEADVDSTASVRAAGECTDPGSAITINSTHSVHSQDGTHQNLDLTRLPIAKGASYNSPSEEHNALCLPNTCTALLHSITKWAQDKDSKPIFWLSGVSGTGKSTVARTVAHSFARNDLLGASFFFKEGESDRGNASRFFATIANDLVVQEPGMLPSVKEALDEDPAISQRALKDQFEKLILQPLLRIVQTRSKPQARVVVIDALDECEQSHDIQAILQLLARATAIQPVPLRVVVTSRLELSVRLSFRQMPDSMYESIVLHDVSRSTIKHNIRLFIEHELSAIQKERMLSLDWPSTYQVTALVELALPLFSYAATMCRYIGEKGGNPKDHLNKVLEYQKSTLSKLDRTYLPILDQLLDEHEEDKKETWLYWFQEVVGSIIVLQSPLSIISLARLLQVPREEVKCQLNSLHSVLSIPNREDVPIRILHMSFRYFLVDPQKKGKSPFWVDEKDTHKKLASRCLELMSKDLRQDMCNLSEPGVLRSEITEGTIASSLSPDLQYACRFWVAHLEQSQQAIVDGDTTHLFLQKYLLYWLEAMSLIKESHQCLYLLSRLQAITWVISL